METRPWDPGRARLALGILVTVVAIVTLMIGQDRDLRPWVLVLAPLTVVAIVAWIGLTERLALRAVAAREAGDDPRAVYRGWEGRVVSAASLVVVVVLVGGLVFFGLRLRDKDLKRAPFLKSETFYALPGCPTSAAGLSALPTGCDDPRYQIRYAPDAFGLPARKGAYWLRVGPDAVQLNFCALQACKFGDVQSGVFPTRTVVVR